MNGADALITTLADNGVTACFANPGTSEMQFVAALDREPRMRSVLCLFEGVATGAADGYGRMAGKPACTLLHLGPGYANGAANLHNARRAFTPHRDLRVEIALRGHQLAHVALGRRDQPRELGVVEVLHLAVAAQLDVVLDHLAQAAGRAHFDVERRVLCERTGGDEKQEERDFSGHGAQHRTIAEAGAQPFAIGQR